MSIIKRFLAALFFGLISLNINAQVKTKTYEEGIPKHFLPVKDLIGKSIIIEPPAEFYKLKQEADRNESAKSKNQLAKFALPSLVNIDVLKEAILTESNGISTYALTIKAPLALNLFVHFNQFILSKNSVLSIYNDSELTDSITSKENNENKLWVTRVYEGNTLNIVLKLPSKEIGESFIRIGSVYLGYKQFGGRFGSPGASESCNINVACPLGVGWEAERNSVAIINGGNGFGSGVLVMNSCGTNTPYVLTAKHILDQANPVATWVFQFFYFSTVCATNTGFREDIQFNGATVKASSGPSDFALVQLNQVPPANSGINYAGWNRGSISSSSFTGLHHPNADVMKISRSFNALTRNAGGNHSYDPTQFWQVIWSHGITAGGSSGSPLFDQNHRIIGVLTDGLSFCSTSNSPDWYGSFDRSWTGGGTNTTRLSNWLDPSNSGAITTNTNNVANLFTPPINGTYLPITGNNVVCGNSQTYTINSLPPGASVVWKLNAPIAAGGDRLPLQNVCTIASAGNQATLTKTGNGNVQLFATITSCGGVVNYANADITFGVPAAYYNGGYWNTTTFQPLTGTINTTNSKTVWVNMAYSVNTNNQYTWYKTSGSSNASWNVYNGYVGYGVNINFTPPVTSSSNFGMNITTTNACGTTSNPVVIYYSGPGIYMIAPNPVSTDLNIETITASNDNSSLDAKNYVTGFDRIEVFDKIGNIVLRKSYPRNTKKVNLNVSTLNSDVYIVRIFNGNKSEEHKIIVQHNK